MSVETGPDVILGVILGAPRHPQSYQQELNENVVARSHNFWAACATFLRDWSTNFENPP
jgi:hypothetical protein